MASHDYWNIAYPRPVHRVGVIANVNDGRPLPSEAAAQLARKQNELVDVTQPFGDETPGGAKFPEERLRRDQFRRDSRIGKAVQHHRSETLHALLPIERIVTDQQNHCCIPC